jgi:tyrosyl-tRNA synthetase
VLTMPNLEGIDGVNKMSKSLDNYISVVDTPKDMFGKTMRISDDLMLRWYELLTDIGANGLSQLKTDLSEKRKHPREVKVNLAKFLIKRFHSEAAAQAAEDEFNRIFVDKGLPDDIPEFATTAQEIGLPALMVAAGLCASNGEGSRLIQGGGVQIDSEKVADAKLKMNLKSGESFVLKAGKKKFVKIVVK